VPKRSKSRFALLKKLRLRWWLLIIAFMGVGSLIGGVELSSQSTFCGTCHIMDPFYDSWQASEHRTVKCIECHIPPGLENTILAKLNGAGQVVDDVLNRVSMKPSAKVANFSCMRDGCHVREELDQPPGPDRSYFFDHDKHLEQDTFGIAIECATCHSHVRGETHFEVNTNVCVVCHLGRIEDNPDKTILASLHGGEVPGGEPSSAPFAAALANTVTSNADSPPASGALEPEAPVEAHAKTPSSDCLNCHEPPDKPFEYRGLMVNHSEFLEFGTECSSCHYGVTAAPRTIGDQECYSCHVFGVDRWTETEEMHDVHTTGEHKVECFECHGWIDHGPAVQEDVFTNFECIKCHADQHQIQRQTYSQSGAVEFDGHDPQSTREISPMFLAHIGCSACHIKPRTVSSNPTSGASVAVAVPEACDACHTPGLGDKMIPLWQRTTRDLYTTVFELYKATRVEGEAARVRVAEARELLEIVRLDGSWGVHNPGYTQSLIEHAREKLVEAAQIEITAAQDGGR
jgi:nitrate/TMAO reductase-like tetraheme cytochrome c subunit